MAMEPVENAYAETPPVVTTEQPQEAQAPPEDAVPTLLKKKIEDCKHLKRELIPEWSKNVEYRRGKAAIEDSDASRNIQAVDWSYTKTKATQLHSKTPQVIVGYEGSGQSPYKLVTPVFQRRLNKRIRDAKIAVAMDEVLPDLINAAGVGAILVSYEARTEMRATPQYDETKLTIVQKAQKALGLFNNPSVDVPFITDRKFKAMRVSPVDLIWDTSAPTSDFDEHALVGHTGRVSKAEAKRRWQDLTDEDIEKASGDDRTDVERLVAEDTHKRNENCVSYDEIFFYRYKYYPDEPKFSAIQHVVFLKGRETPLINEPWKGQQVLEDGSYVGACKLPLRVGTLTYISDEPIPPSDSSIIRPMVDELLEYAQDQKEQRKHSVPVRWADVTRLAPETLQNMVDGEFQGIVFTNGDGSRAIGEVARASYPRESDILQRNVRQDLREAFKVGPNQLGTPTGDSTATEADIVERNFSSEVGYERGKTTALFLGVVEVLAGLVLLYDDFDMFADLSEQDKARLQGVDLRKLNVEATFTIRPDSTVLLDSEQEYKRLDRFLNIGAKSGMLNSKPIMERMAALTQLDPAEVIIEPKPNSPDQPNISFRFAGAEDLTNPVALALLMKHGQAPTVEELEAAFKLLKASGIPPALVNAPVKEIAEPEQELNPDDPNPGWNMADRLDRRNAERGVQ